MKLLIKNNKNKEGFTLVELLAVIVVLAIIITIAIVAVNGQIKKAKENSFIEKCYQYIKAAEYHEVSDDPQNPYMYIFPNDTTLSLKEKPDAGYIYRNEEHQYRLSIWDDKLNKCAVKDFDQEKIVLSSDITTKEECTIPNDLDVPINESHLSENQYQIAYAHSYPRNINPGIIDVYERGETATLGSVATSYQDKIPVGWNTKPDGSGTTYGFGEQLVDPTDKKTLYLYPYRIDSIGDAACPANANFASSSKTLCKDNLNIDVGSNIVCKRAILLHDDRCQSMFGTTGCDKKNPRQEIIKYGNCGTHGTLNYGDAFTCDVDGDGVFNEYSERFYYVNRYFDTNNSRFDSSTAVLIYYNYVVDGKPCNRSGDRFRYTNSNYGPGIISQELPTTSMWKNVSLKNSQRLILDTENHMVSTKPFSYSNYSARLLTVQELASPCGIPFREIGGIRDYDLQNADLTSCDFIFENSNYTFHSSDREHFFLENYSSYSVLMANSDSVSIVKESPSFSSRVKPVIEVPIDKIAY